MKKWLSFTATVLLIGSTLVWGIEPIAVENASFELPGLEKYKCWDAEDEGAVDVNGWTSDDNPYDSGVETGWGATDGEWTAFLMSGDPSVWQVTDHDIAIDEILRLQVDAKNNWAATTLQMSLFAYDELVDPNDPNIVTPVRTPICVQDMTLTDETQTFTLECVVADVPEAAGYKLGIELCNTSEGDSWLGMDNVQLFSIIPTGINVVIVSNTHDNDGDGIQDDLELANWLADEGHTVDYRLDYWNTFDPIDPCDPNEVPKIDVLNAADLVIMSRSSNSGDYDDGDEPTMWNSVETPLIQLSSWLTRSSRWKWINSTSATKTDAATLLEAVDLDHALFDGIELAQLNIVDPNDLIDPNDPNAPIVLPDPIYGAEVLDASVGASLNSFINTVDMGNGTLIAKTYGADMGWIAEWESAVEYYDGAGQVAADHRMMLCFGTQEEGATPQGAWNMNANGETLLRNAVAYMLYQPLPAREPSPASGTTAVALDGTLSWRPGKLATLYEVQISTDQDAVANGTALVDVVEGTSYDLAPLGLILGTTYYWRIDATDGEQTWPGEVQSFTTTDFIVIDDFEGYTNDDIGNTWKGAMLGSAVSVVPEVNEAVAHSGVQSLALPFDNSTNPFYANVDRIWSSPQNWTKAGATTLTFHFYGDPGNDPGEKLWARVNGIQLNYGGDGLQKAEWTTWNIKLTSLPTPQWKIAKIEIGVGDAPAPAGYQGILYVDDVRLYRVAP